MNYVKNIGCLILLLCSLSNKVYSLDEEAVIIDRYRKILLESEIKDNNVKNFKSWFDKATHRWNDLDYGDQSRAGWDVTSHVRRTRYLAIAYCKTSSDYYGDEELIEIINQAIAEWTEHPFENRNWFPMEVTIPSILLDVTTVLGDKITPENRKEILKYAGDIRIRKFGINFIWLAENVMRFALLTNDQELALELSKKISDEIVVGVEVGLQEDYSYYFHEQRLQQFSYGGAFLSESTRIAWGLRGTKYALPTEKIKILGDYLLNGMQWMTRGQYTVPSTMDRSSSRKDALMSTFSEQTITLLMDLDSERADQYEELLKTIRLPFYQNIVGVKAFPKGELLANQQKDYTGFLKVVSKRTFPTQSFNEENLKGKFLNFGNTYFLKNGEEYTDLMPFWDWNMLPGFTYQKGMDKLIRKEFTGVISSGSIGVAFMDYAFADKTGEACFSAKKLWVSQGANMIALIADIKGDSASPILTAMDQSRWKGWVRLDNEKVLSEPGDYDLTDVSWLFHNGFVYNSLAGQGFKLKLADKTNSWGEINGRYKKEGASKDKVFLPYLIYQDGPMAYSVAPAHSKEEAGQFVAHPSYKIKQNGNKAQVIALEGGSYAGVIWERDYEVVLNGVSLAANEPISFIFEQGELLIHNPDAEVHWIEVAINGKAVKVESDKLNGNRISPVEVREPIE